MRPVVCTAGLTKAGNIAIVWFLLLKPVELAQGGLTGRFTSLLFSTGFFRFFIPKVDIFGPWSIIAGIENATINGLGR
jgi:hypothetical protein